MSQENVEFVKRVHAAFNRDGVEAVLSGMPSGPIHERRTAGCLRRRWRWGLRCAPAALVA
jgi:hypothetical protein